MTPPKKLDEFAAVSFWSAKVRYHRSMTAVHSPGSDEWEYHSKKMFHALQQLKSVPEDATT